MEPLSQLFDDLIRPHKFLAEYPRGRGSPPTDQPSRVEGKQARQLTLTLLETLDAFVFRQHGSALSSPASGCRMVYDSPPSRNLNHQIVHTHSSVDPHSAAVGHGCPWGISCSGPRNAMI